MENNEQKIIAEQTKAPEVKKDNRIEGTAAEGLVEAVASTAMSVVAVAMMLSMSLNPIPELLCMYGFILGIRAINTYRTCHLWQKKKPTATLVLGIIGVVVNTIAMIAWLLWIAGFFILMIMEV